MTQTDEILDQLETTLQAGTVTMREAAAVQARAAAEIQRLREHNERMAAALRYYLQTVPHPADFINPAVAEHFRSLAQDALGETWAKL